MEKAEKTAGLILLPQAGTQTKNNVNCRQYNYTGVGLV